MPTEPANMDALRAALKSHPEAVLGQTPDGRLIVLLERLSGDSRDLTRFGLAMRWAGQEKATSGVWLVTSELAGGGAGGETSVSGTAEVTPGSMLGHELDR